MEPQSKLGDTVARQLAGLLNGGSDVSQLWEPGELDAIFRHQMATPIALDLGDLALDLKPHLDAARDLKGRQDYCYSDLFRDPQPSLSLLRLVKNYAKANRGLPDRSLPKDVALMLYYACIAAAWVRCRTMISTLDREHLRQGAQWARKQPWAGERLTRLFADFCAELDQSDSDSQSQ